MLSHKEILLQHLYYEEALRQAEKDRLVRRILVEQTWGKRPHHRALNWLGSHLVAWGRGLQERYGAPVVAPR
jgi:hypothetical protein